MLTEAKPSPLQSFVERTDQPLFRFCQLMTVPEVHLEELVTDIYRTFSRRIRRKGADSTPAETLQIELFRAAMDALFGIERSRPRLSLAGRDTRGLKALESDLLSWWRANPTDKAGLTQQIPSIGDRLRMLDFDLRAPVVLNDHLKLDQDVILKILGLRWAVFRHRLHRGRVELQKLLQGVVFSAPIRTGRA
ncbi:MAG: hypothetical protein HYR96_12960 [Deltaproteobacteria bacterium]|nr:hypothetical protein [Deltaproteobacteria bacterium]MBI3293913.1 hypothetical protein [Deltaproteobacteria bacterium]